MNANNIPTHFTAWLTTTVSMLDQPNMDIAVLEDELIGDPADGDAAWACIDSRPILHVVTAMDAETYTTTPFPEAEDILNRHGWTTIGQWINIGTGYTATVTRNA